MFLIKKIKTSLRPVHLRNEARREVIAELRAEGNATLSAIASALEDVMNRTCNSAEAAWIDKIEKVREELHSSQETITIDDHGAGSHWSSFFQMGDTNVRSTMRTVGSVCRDSSKSKRWHAFLFALVRRFRPAKCLELGTALGMSAAYQGAALALNNKGHILTLEGAPSLASIARKIFIQLGLGNIEVVGGRFQDTLQNIAEKNGPFDFVFIDGHHEEQATQEYYDLLVPYLAEGALLIFDDIAWSAGMVRAWSALRQAEHLTASVDICGMGLCVHTTQHDGRRRQFDTVL